MKVRSFLMLPVLALAIVACKSNGSSRAAAELEKVQADTANYTTIQWLDSTVNFGTVNFGEQVKVTFRFKNTGTKPLILSNVVAGCGCTVPDFTKSPVAPGEQGVVTGAFDSNKSHPGSVRKNIRVTANTKPQQQFELVFTGELKEK
ncbi:DUF1573 domain-containing protein [Deminuibacter soli]|uniref:DUF1573 domain-containing protein n=1 Tax=Deminuibacter soli TaxID=2291815 RepID=A0A3E1NK42_9BACT|nr:DUF1573 domain-containing protein [Deminuibacter soli]RFM28148.1 DUF1573 domain-containing protein [Deminuibacter soli]